MEVGNDYWDACEYSPARLESAITVGASTMTDALAHFSNYGTCIDIMAPGEGIVSAGITETSKSQDGTSMASPHVAGVVARLLGIPSTTWTTDSMKVI